MGLQPTTPRPKVTCSTDGARQEPPGEAIFKDYENTTALKKRVSYHAERSLGRNLVCGFYGQGAESVAN